MSIAIIGGTGVEMSTPDAREEVIQTRWGKALVTRAEIVGRELFFLHRHADADSGRRHVPPHKINYRANIAALKKLGATTIFASTAVGSLREEWPSGTLVSPDQFLDFTTNRAKTFFDERAVHIDVTQPYCPQAREYLKRAAQDLQFDLQDGATYICADGPRFETPAEIRAFKSWGADVVGMTGVPEVVLAREAEISYAGISIVTNAAAGISQHPLTQAEVMDAMKIALPRVVELFLRAAQSYDEAGSTPARHALAEFVSDEWNPRVVFD
jgi:5'-methylthioadenosine phosphorylase